MFLLFFQRVISELPQPITAKPRHMIGTCVNFINRLQKFEERSPHQKNGGQKHAKFRSILYHLRLWSRTSPEWLKISKTESECFQIDSSCVLRKRSGELWSTNYRDLIVSLDPLKCTYLAYNVSALKWPQMFTCARDWGRLASAHPKRDGGPPKKFQSWKFKIWLKIQRMSK